MQAWTVVRFLHVAGLAGFAGTQFALALAVVPALRRSDEVTQRRVVHRLGFVSAAALALAVATGIAMASHFSLWSSNVLQGKLVLLVLVAALAGLQLLSPATRTIAYAASLGSLLVIWLGIKLTYG
jgi:hypothetical protein